MSQFEINLKNVNFSHNFQKSKYHWVRVSTIYDLLFTNWNDSRFIFSESWIEIDLFHFVLNWTLSMNPLFFPSKIHKISALEWQNLINLQIWFNLEELGFVNRFIWESNQFFSSLFFLFSHIPPFLAWKMLKVKS